MSDEKKDEKEKGEVVTTPSDSLTVAGALRALAGKEQFADVNFIVGKGKEQRVIPAHKVILAASSEFFEAMLYPIKFPDDKEKKEKHEPEEDIPEIEIPDVKPRAFKIMLQCLYSDTCDITAEDLDDVMDIAYKFQLESLRQACLAWMEEGVTPDNACTLFQNALTGDKDEKHFALTFIEENTESVVATPGWDLLTEEKLISVLQSDDLTIDEIDLFQACLRWALSECKRRSLETTTENRNICLSKILPQLRFPNMTMDQLATAVTGSGVLTNSQLLSLYTYVGQAEGKKGKTEFSSTPRAGSKDKWALDTVSKSTSIVLSNGNLTARNTSGGYSYCQGTVSFSKGQHAWRVTRDSANTAWLFLGASRKLPHNDQSYTQHTVWGLTSAGQQYVAGTASSMTTNFQTGPLEVLLDCDEGTLVVANYATNQRYTMSGLPKSSALTPHFCLQTGQQISVNSIPVREFARGFPA